MLSRNKLFLTVASIGFLYISLPPSYSNPNFDEESNDINNEISLTKKSNLDTYTPNDKFDEYIIKGGIYSTKFVPLMNDGSDGSDYTSIMANDGKRL